MYAIITQRQTVNSYGSDCDLLEKEYINFYNRLGIKLIPISNFQTPNFYNAQLLILTGGGNIYKEQPQRDLVEAELFKTAIKKQIPIIAVCRGMQYINLLLGGNLSSLDNLKTERVIGIDHEVYLKNKKFYVNNFHQDGIFKNNLAPNLKILAVDKENDVIEAFYSNEMKILGIQWHPERHFTDEKSGILSEKIIKDFINKNGEINESDYTCGG